MSERLANLLAGLLFFLASAAPVQAQEIILVTSTDNSGPGTLRAAMELASPGTTISFDPTVFPVDAPATIYVEEQPLPPIVAGSVTIDASEAGVILDGSRGDPDNFWFFGLHIISDHNVVRGLSIVNFPWAGIRVVGSHNSIGGANPTPADGCRAACNLVSGNGQSGGDVAQIEVLNDPGARDDVEDLSGNVIQGNFIGTDQSGTAAYGESFTGISIWDVAGTVVGGETPGQGNIIGGHEFAGIVDAGEGTVIAGNSIGVGSTGQPVPNAVGVRIVEATGSIVGPTNLIASNSGAGIVLDLAAHTGNSITGNAIFSNGVAIAEESDGEAQAVPITLSAEPGAVVGTTLPGATVDFYSDDGDQAQHFEGSVQADAEGTFRFPLPESGVQGSHLTALATASDGTTSRLSPAIEVSAFSEQEGEAIAPAVAAGEPLLVTSPANYGPGTLRQALERASPGTIITFDPTVFPLDAPATIYVEEEPLPPITTGNVTVDASGAGVILDGSRGTPEDPWFVGLNLRSDENVVKGLSILNFPFSGIWIEGDRNLIGGRNATPGGSCSGDCNLVSGNGWAAMGEEGVTLEVRQIETRSGEGIPRVGNIISGNYIGTDLTGTRVYGESGMGIFLFSAVQTVVGGDTPAERNVIGGHTWGIEIYNDGAGHVIKGNYIGIGVSGEPLPNEIGMRLTETRETIIGPDNFIAFNTNSGINIRDENTGVTITRNAIYANGQVPLNNISSDIPRGAITVVPFIFLNNDEGNVNGSTIPGAIVEIYSGDGGGARYYEGTVVADDDGDFSFNAPAGGFSGDQVTATATSQDGTTSFMAVAVRPQVALPPPQPAPPPPPVVALEGIPRPGEVSLDPKDIGISLGLAITAVLFFGFTSTTFNALLEEHAPELNRILPRSLGQRLGRQRPLHTTWQVALAWLAILFLTAAIESFLKPGPLFDRQRLAVLLGLFIAALIINAADLLVELWFRQRVLPRTRFRFEPIFIGLLIAIAAVVLSRLMQFEPGYVYGIVGIMLLLPAMPAQHAGRHALMSILTLLVIGLVAWLLTLLAPAGTALDSILLTLFLLSVEAAFFGMLPILTNKGRDLWQWRRKVWALIMAVVFFVFFHLLLQPAFEDMQLLRQNSLQTVAILMGIFGTLTFALWIYVNLRARSNEVEAMTD